MFIAKNNYLILFILFKYSVAVRNKEIDENYQRLIPLNQIPNNCEHSKDNEVNSEPAKEYGFVENIGLEKCKVWLDEEQSTSSDENGHYERYKCKHLRVHGHFNEETGKCECKTNWKGLICNEFIGCPVNYSYFLNVCTPNVCQHDGQLALGSKHIECICKAPWDGRFCERLACWRMADKEHERRWRNSIDHCKCADNYSGENCETIISCQNGEFINEKCQCAEGWTGEICDRKCTPGQTCGADSLLFGNQIITFLIILFTCLMAFINRLMEI
ncbi:unnamed protein product [Meloidogyne enterolobii]|uniref:Uncharacterized protein n=1 Tax=Meloidogyne enterolobii TaxID=390850 RepID=A0ACB0YFM3_MELEN